MLASAGINVAEVFLAKDTFDAGDFGYGLLVGGYGPRARARQPRRRAAAGAASGLADLSAARSCWSRWRSARGRSPRTSGSRPAACSWSGAANGARGRLQRAARAARLAGRAARARLHAADELVASPSSRSAWSSSGPLTDAVGAALGLGRVRGLRGARRRCSRWSLSRGIEARRQPRLRRVAARRDWTRRDAGRGRPGRRPARGRARDHARRELATRSPTSSSATSTPRPAARTRSGSPARPASASRA